MDFLERYQMQTPINNEKLNIRLSYDSHKSEAVILKYFNSKQKWSSELKILKLLQSHKHIIRLIDSNIKTSLYSDKYFIVVEYAENGNLLQYLLTQPTQRLSENESNLILKQLISAVYWCHSNNIMHGDIKLTNIFIKADKTIILGDFGLSFKISSKKTSNKYQGTPAFMSPQLIEAGISRKYYNCRATDVWALGVVFFVLLFGFLPFEDDDDLRMFDLIRHYPLKIPQKVRVSVLIENLLYAMLEKNESKRITSEKLRIL